MSTDGKPTQHAQGKPETRHRTWLAIAIGCYVLAAIAGMYLVAGSFDLGLQVPLWIAHTGLLILLIRRLGAPGTYAALFIVGASVMSVGVAGMAREDLTLQQRGNEVTATVSKERRDPGQGRKNRDYHYTLQRQDGTPVPGPDLTTPSDLYEVGQTVTVIADPEGELAPRTPGQADATGELLGASAFALAALASVGWMARRGSATAQRGSSAATLHEQEQQLREALGTYPADRRGYIKVHPGDYPDLSHHQAARIAWEAGLRAEASGNRGSWRFAETVVEEVPHD
ncbi:hypothetical protein ABZ916_15105 [Streptomyces sp. NPDC046853]|uniref:hypothetical protein n=1 Tax=Streptomyces sp. NPDC046853 TaxID=3154920 RepID=UPI0033DB381E